jgi:glycosyltransferase involved in cell wall biosynthesis
MRVLEVTESFATGTMEVVRLIAEQAARDGHAVAIAYGVRPETPADLGQRIGAEVEQVELPWAGRTLLAQLRAARALRRLCRDWKPDVVHLHSSFAGAVGSLAIPRGIPTVYTPHAYSFLTTRSRLSRVLYRSAERFIARRTSMVGAVSKSEARLARDVGATSVEVIPNGIPELDQPPTATRSPSEPPAVVTVGRIVRQRQPAATARIMASVADIAAVEWIGGPGPDESLAGDVRALGIPVTGWLDRDVAVRRLSQATVLLNWSAWDSHPLGVLEAMAFDVLVIGSDIEANRDLLGAEQVRASEDQAAELLREVLTDRDRREELLETQRARSRPFAASQMARDWLRIYDRLTAFQVAAKPRARRAGVDRLTA